MVRPAILLGAGASKDAGLPDAFELTELIHRRLSSRHPREAHLFAFVVAKLNVRRVRRGGSPFERVNVEDAYYALKRYLARDEDSLSEFVAQWDDHGVAADSSFDATELARGLSGLFGTSKRSLSGTSSIQPQAKNVLATTEQISRIARNANPVSTFDAEVFLNALESELNPEHIQNRYLRKFVSKIAIRSDCVATLNYDTALEQACVAEKRQFDRGLKDWNQRRTVSFRQENAVRLYKLHGSIDWSFSDEDAIIENANHLLTLKKAMVLEGSKINLLQKGLSLHYVKSSKSACSAPINLRLLDIVSVIDISML